MNSKTILKMLLDIAMVILYLLLMFARFAGDLFHEIVGIGIGVIFVIHLALNASMIKGLFKSVKKGNAKTDRIILFVSDIVLTIAMPVVILTGILIAKELFVIDIGLPIMTMFDIHNICSYICLFILALHILLHAKYLIGVIKKLPSSFSGKEMKTALLRFFSGVLVAGILYVFVVMLKNSIDKHNMIDEGLPPHEGSEVTETIENTTESETSGGGDKDESSEESKEEESTGTDDEDSTEEEETESETEEETTTPPPTLSEYLSRLRCNGCGRGCILLSPRCSEGRRQAKEAEYEYYQKYDVTGT